MGGRDYGIVGCRVEFEFFERGFRFVGNGIEVGDRNHWDLQADGGRLGTGG